MHQTARWTARHSSVALAFLILILALILAGCAGVHGKAAQPGAAASTWAGVPITSPWRWQSLRTPVTGTS